MFLRAAVTRTCRSMHRTLHKASSELPKFEKVAGSTGARALVGAMVGAATFTFMEEADDGTRQAADNGTLPQRAHTRGGRTEALRYSDAFKRTGVYDLDLGDGFPDVLPCFIEVAKGSRNKYEWDDAIGFLRLDRVLHSAVFYPHNYGFIPQTLCGDGDPLDVLVLGEALVPGSIVDVRPLGYMIMEDEKGLDEKVLAVPKHDPRFSEYKTLRDVPDHLLREIAHFFGTYKALEKQKWAKVGGWKGTVDTISLIEETHGTYVKEKGVASTPAPEQ